MMETEYICVTCQKVQRYGHYCLDCEPKKQEMRSEMQEQADLIKWLRERGKHPIAIPNGTQGSAKRNRLARQVGQHDGAPDLIIPLSGRMPMAVELKQKKGGTQSDAQKRMQAYLEDYGWIYILAHGAEEAQKKILEVL